MKEEETLTRLQRYESKRKTKRVSFNIELEKVLWEHADNIQDFSKWVKDKLNEDLKNKDSSL